MVVFDFLTGELKYQRANLKNRVETIPIQQDFVDNKRLTLKNTPYADNGFVLFVDSVPQRIGIDYEIDGKDIVWEGLGLDGFIDSSDTVTVIYNYF